MFLKFSDIEISSSSSGKKPARSSSNSSLQSESDSCNGDSSTGSTSNNGNIISSTNDISNSSVNGNSTNGAKNFVKGKSIGGSSSGGGISNHYSAASNGVSAVEQLLQVGRELQSLSIAMRRMYGHNENNKKLMENAFSLLAYADPWDSPVGWQLSPRQREPVCAALNSAILQSIQLPRTPPLQVALNHAHLLLTQQARSGLGACAFIDLDMQADIK